MKQGRTTQDEKICSSTNESKKRKLLQYIKNLSFIYFFNIIFTDAAAGGSMDWVRVAIGPPITYTYELRDKGRYGFLLPANQIIPTGEETMDSLIGMFQKALDLGYGSQP